MRRHKFTIPGKLPGLNTFLRDAKAKKGMYVANSQKQTIEELVAVCAMQTIKARPIERPVIIEYHWIEPDRRRDLDNIAFAKKFINDALVKVGILKNDGWKDIVAISDRFSVDKKNPRIEVTLQELTDKEIEKVKKNEQEENKVHSNAGRR